MPVSFGPLRDGDEEAQHNLTGLAFGDARAFDPDYAVPRELVLAGYRGSELVATATLIPGGQWLGGRPIAGTLVSGVAVAPHRRGAGISKPLMAESLRLMHERGDAISALYPTTASLYRSVGYEMAGDYVKRVIAMDELRAAPTEAAVEPFTIDELPSLAPRYDAVARLSPGYLARGEQWWRRRQIRLRYRSTNSRLYLLELELAGAKGYLVMGATESDNSIMNLHLEDLGAENGAVLRALGSVVTRFGTVAGSVSSHQAPWVLETLTDHGQRWKATESFGWMLRLVDVGRAVALRGWPPLKARISLRISDPVLSHNDGNFELKIENGRGRLERSGAGTWQIGIGSLASWFSGWPAR